jgi:pimeloyl-ACP methyl ester carboxylesterase
MVTDLRPELARITVPFTILYVFPANAPMPLEQFDATMRQSFANAQHARLVRIDQSNHFIQLDQPGRFVTEVDAFMRQ